MVIYRHAHHNPGQPDPQGTIASEPPDTAEASKERFLNYIFSIDGIPG
jgi:hypothetical protein